MTFRPETTVAAVFDIGGVFTYPSWQPVAAKLTDLGVTLPGEIDIYRRAHHAGVRALANHTAPTEHIPDFWVAYDEAYGRSLGVPAGDLGDFRVAVRMQWSWVHDDNVAAFHRLADAGFPVAIVSNNDGTAPDQMREYGVCQVGDGPLPSVAAVVDSTLEGVAKPDPRIFDPAIDALDVDPAHIVYIGDTVQADVAGATNAGMQVIQLDPYDHHADFGHTRMRDLDEVVAALGVTG